MPTLQQLAQQPDEKLVAQAKKNFSEKGPGRIFNGFPPLLDEKTMPAFVESIKDLAKLMQKSKAKFQASDDFTAEQAYQVFLKEGSADEVSKLAEIKKSREIVEKTAAEGCRQLLEPDGKIKETVLKLLGLAPDQVAPDVLLGAFMESSLESVSVAIFPRSSTPKPEMDAKQQVGDKDTLFLLKRVYDPDLSHYVSERFCKEQVEQFKMFHDLKNLPTEKIKEKITLDLAQHQYDQSRPAFLSKIQERLRQEGLKDAASAVAAAIKSTKKDTAGIFSMIGAKLSQLGRKEKNQKKHPLFPLSSQMLPRPKHKKST